MSDAVQSLIVTKVGRTVPSSEVPWSIPTEVPVGLIYNDTPHTVLMASPADLDDLVIGFSLTEGVINQADEITRITQTIREEGIELRVQIPQKRMERLELHNSRRAHMARSGCGLCGLTQLSDAIRPVPMLADGPTIARGAILTALKALRDHQPLRQKTRSVHGAAFADTVGTITLSREDVGRHNALDKMIGARARANDRAQGFAIISARIGFELAQKAALANIPILVSVSAPTSASLRIAQAANLTLISRINDDEFVTFCGSARIID